MKTYVWVIEAGTVGEVVGGLNAFYTNVRYSAGGIDFEVLLENDEFYVMEDGDND